MVATPIFLTTSPAADYSPDWSPDGSEIAFHSIRTGNRELFVMPANGGEPVQVTDAPTHELVPHWSPDGLEIAFWSDRSGHFAPYYISRDRVGGEWSEIQPLTTDLDVAAGFQGAWSPDGSSFAYADANGIKLGSLGGNPRVILSFTSSTITAANPFAWSSDGTAIFVFGNADDGSEGIWSVLIATGTPRLLVIDDDLRTSMFMVRRYGNVFYLTLTEEESDIFTMDLSFE